MVKCPENGRNPQKLGSSGSAFPLDNPKKGKTLISSIFRRISRRMKIKVTSKRKFTRKAGSAAYGGVVKAVGANLGDGNFG